jgi:hypothetical protein
MFAENRHIALPNVLMALAVRLARPFPDPQTPTSA